jgi:ABC-2 type transport system permease protein
MMRIINIVKYDLIKTIRDKTSLIFMIIMPVVFIFIFGSIKFTGTTKIPVGIADNDNGSFSKELIEQIKDDHTVSFTVMSEKELLSKVQNSGIEAGFVIPKGFSKDITDGKVPEIKVIKLKTSENSMVIQNVISTALLEMRAKDSVVSIIKENFKDGNIPGMQNEMESLSQKIALNLQKPDFITVETTRYSDSQKSNSYDNKAFITIGFMIMFVMMAIIFCSTGVILDEKKDNTWNRMIITPTRKSTIIFGNVLSTFLKGMLQVLFLVLFSKFAIGVNWGQSLSALVIVMSVFVLSVTGMGIFMATFVKTNSQLSAIAAIVVTCTTMISGCYWPLELEPQIMQNIAVLFPQYWAMKGMRNVIENGMGIESVVTPVLVLALMGIVYFIGSVIMSGLKTGPKKNMNRAAEVKGGML